MPEQLFPPGLHDHPLNAAINQALASQHESFHRLPPLDPVEAHHCLARYRRQLSAAARKTVMHSHWHMIPGRRLTLLIRGVGSGE